MHSECNLTKGDFIFHRFKNRYDEYDDKLPLDVNIPYYMVGNLNSPGDDELPSYVLETHSNYPDNSNTDRIIVSIKKNKWIERVYVTLQIDNSNYDTNSGFRISRRLLIISEA